MCAGVEPVLKERKNVWGKNLPQARLAFLLLTVYFHLVPHERLEDDGVGTFCIPEHCVRS